MTKTFIKKYPPCDGKQCESAAIPNKAKEYARMV